MIHLSKFTVFVSLSQHPFLLSASLSRARLFLGKQAAGATFFIKFLFREKKSASPLYVLPAFGWWMVLLCALLQFHAYIQDPISIHHHAQHLCPSRLCTDSVSINYAVFQCEPAVYEKTVKKYRAYRYGSLEADHAAPLFTLWLEKVFAALFTGHFDVLYVTSNLIAFM